MRSTAMRLVGLTWIIALLVGCLGPPQSAGPTPTIGSTSLPATQAATMTPASQPSPIHTPQVKSTPTVVAPTDPPPTEEPAVRVVSDLVYATSLQPDGVSWELDVYAPTQDGDWPVVVFLHGFRATKDGHPRESQAIAKQGAVVFTITWPTWITDLAVKDQGRGFREMDETIACGIHYARERGPEYQGDPDRMVLVGFSMGAVMGAKVALAGDQLDLQWEDYASEHGGPDRQMACIADETNTSVSAFIGVGGPYAIYDVHQERTPELWEVVSPAALIGLNPDVKFHILHGDRDTYVSPDQSTQFNDALAHAGYDVRLTMYDGTHLVPRELTAGLVQDMAME